MQDVAEDDADCSGASVDVRDLLRGGSQFGGAAKVPEKRNRQRAVAHGGNAKHALAQALSKLQAGLKDICDQPG